tara:strand:+ start:2153 stop:2725 length:573 start_codon:yes stop_codon:yes gene_type:complete
MKLDASIKRLLKNRIVLYVVFFFSVTNVLGYLTTGNTNAVVFFALVGFLANQFSKNMTVVLLMAMVSTNLLMSRGFREGNENMKKKNKKAGEPEDDEEDETEDPADEKVKDPEYIDAAATKTAALGNLEDMVGENGIQGLAKETETLVKNQKDLMKAMEGMKPLMGQASGLMKQFNDLKVPDMMGGKKKE